jgi:hypothetical protein
MRSKELMGAHDLRYSWRGGYLEENVGYVLFRPARFCGPARYSASAPRVSHALSAPAKVCR